MLCCVAVGATESPEFLAWSSICVFYKSISFNKVIAGQPPTASYSGSDTNMSTNWASATESGKFITSRERTTFENFANRHC